MVRYTSLGLYRALSRSTRLRPACFRCLSSRIPFQDDLTSIDYDDFNLQDFLHYKELDDVIKQREKAFPESRLANNESLSPKDHLKNNSKAEIESAKEFKLEEVVVRKEPLVFISKINDPYLNLAIEDFIYNNMPLPDDEADYNFNRLMLYVNAPCVVIGRNQNPWAESNLPLLTSLGIPLVRRFSGGGTVVHDLGNMNYSFMTTKKKFSRTAFSHIIKNNINPALSDGNLQVNDRGDLLLLHNKKSFKVSGSAYRLSRGKSYHHGTMLLNLNLKILGKLLSNDMLKNGTVDALSAVSSVKSNVANLNLATDKFIDLVVKGFKEEYGLVEDPETFEKSSKAGYHSLSEPGEEFDQIELLGLENFYAVPSRKLKTYVLDNDLKFNNEVYDTMARLKSWAWKFGSTPKFSHEFYNKDFNFTVKFFVNKGGLLDRFDLDLNENVLNGSDKDKIIDSFSFLTQILQQNPVEYRGSNIAGFITDDAISDWIGMCIDGTI